MKEITIKVDGMVCSGCENRLKNALETINGVVKVIASHETGIVQITFNNELDPSLLEQKIEDIGFTVKKDN